LTHAEELKRGERFEFGQNWANFLKVVDDERIAEAKLSLQRMLGVDRLDGKRFLDVGSGSGLFSLAARMLGARVHSFDFDPKSVACAHELRRRYFPDDIQWHIQEGSVLDREFLAGLGHYDVVYSWGVLHHTGQMNQALNNVAPLVNAGGQLFIAIYNDQGGTSKRWTMVKRLYCNGRVGRIFTRLIFFPYFGAGRFVSDLRFGRNPFTSYGHYRKSRGMSVIHDWEDWLGGYPFEVAKPEEIFDLYRELGFTLERLKTCAGGLGCNEFVFRRRTDS
jgi:SAM-dependent methyltransferase